MDKYKSLGINTFFVFLGNAGAKLIGLLMLPLYTRWLSVEDYGITDLVSVYVTLLIGVVSCSIKDSVFLFPKDQKKEEQTKYLSSALDFLGISAIVVAGLFVIIDIVSKQYSINNSFTDHLWLIYLMLYAQVIQDTLQQFTRCLNKMLVYSITGMVVTSCTALFAFIFIPRWGVNGYITSIAAAYLCGAIYSTIASKSYSNIRIGSFSSFHVKQMLKYSVPLVPNAMMWWMVNAINRPLLEKYSSYHDIGLYAVAGKFPSIMTMLFTIFLTSWTISVVEEYGKPGYKDFFNQVFRTITVCSAFVLLIITLCSKLFILLFATDEYISGWYLIPIMTLGFIFSSLSGIVATVFSAIKESKYYFYSSIYAAIAAVIFNLLLVPRYNITGAAIATLLSMLVMFLSRVAFSWRYSKIENLGKLVFVYALCAIVYVLMLKEVHVYVIVVTSSLFILYFIYSLRDIFRKVWQKTI